MKAISTPSFFEKSWFRILVWLLLLLPPVVYLWLAFRESVNIPYRDDFNWYFRLISKYDQTDSLGDTIRLILSQHDQHRQVPLKFSAILSTELTGRVNIRLLNFLGNFSLVAAYVYWIWQFRRAGLVLFTLIPLGFLWFQPQYWLNVIGGNLANFPVNLLVALTLFSLNRPGWRAFLWAVLAACIASVSNGNGMFVFVCGAFLLVINAEPRRLILWLLAAAAAITFYFTFDNFYFSGHAGDTRILPKLVSSPHKILIYLWTFLGSFVLYDKNLFSSYAALILGILISIPFIVSLRYTLWPSLVSLVRGRWTWNEERRPDEPKRALLKVVQATFVFLLMTALAIYLFRSDMASFPDFPLYDYYKINAVMACGFSVVMAYLIWRPALLLTLPALAASVFFWATSYFSYSNILFTIRQTQLAEGLNWHLNRRWVLYGPIGMFTYDFANRYTHDLVTRRQYAVPAYSLPVLQRLLTEPNPAVLHLPFEVDYQFESFWFHPRKPLPPVLAGNEEAFFVLRNATGTYLLPITPHKNSWKRALVLQEFYDLTSSIKLPDATWQQVLKPGLYDLFIVDLRDSGRIWQLPFRWNMAGTSSGLVATDSTSPGS